MPSLNNNVEASLPPVSITAPSSTPSPAPSHLSQKILEEDATGYIAPTFEGKAKQMKLGLPSPLYPPPSDRCMVVYGRSMGMVCVQRAADSKNQ